MNVKIKKLDESAQIPKYSKPGDAGLDLIATGIEQEDVLQVIYNTGLAVEIPEGYFGLILPRSSIFKYNLSLSNSVGLIDSGYRGELKFIFNKEAFKTKEGFKKYKIGDRIGQLVIMPYPKINLIEVEELTDSERGLGGFGSSGT